MFQKFYFRIIFILCILGGSLSAQKRSVDEIQKNYQESLSFFLSMKQKKLLTDGATMNHLFLLINTPSDELIAQMRSDNQALKKSLKKLKRLQRRQEIADSDLEKNIEELKKYHQDYADLYSYIKKYDLNNDVAVFHQNLKKRWSTLWDCINQGEDIVCLLKDCGIHQSDVTGLKELIVIVKQDQKKINEYEDLLHTDWIDLKLANYVYKIELIRLRNAAYFHTLYNGMNIKSVYPKW
ncbi:MAG: hypothetical protein NTZ68_03680 [Candidatus Dependentiae bacterium]|nr:hypothetical protein [Candidatus Dependentiae bacterium]